MNATNISYWQDECAQLTGEKYGTKSSWCIGL